MKIEIKHDGFNFQTSVEAIQSREEILGFYFDGRNFPQVIYRDSLYGAIILNEYKKGLTLPT